MGIRLKTRHELHLARKAWHVSTGIFGLWAYVFSGISRTGSIAILSSILAFVIGMELLRLNSASINRWSQRWLGVIMRKHEAQNVSGVPYFVAAALISIILFPKPIAILAILYLTIGDPCASVVGILYGDQWIRFSNGKSLLGAIASGGVCFASTFPVLAQYEISFWAILVMGLMGGVAAAAAETIPSQIDDNFVIPLASGFVLWGVAMMLGVEFIAS